MEKENYKGYDVTIKFDEYPDDPRTWDNFGTIAGFHKRYSLGDKVDFTSDEFDSWDEMEEYIKKELKAVVIYPLYLYDHSVLRLKIGDFYGLLPQGHAQFDSGQVGFTYCTKEDIKKNWGIKKVTKQYMEKAEALLRGEVEAYDAYLSGNIYEYLIEKEDEVIDSCGGYTDSEHCDQDAKSAVEHILATTLTA